jgi:hypothetical protein
MKMRTTWFVVGSGLVLGATLAWADLHLERPTPLRTVTAGTRQVRWNNLYAESVRYNYIIRLIFEDRLTITATGRGHYSYSQVDYTLLSVVGPVVSYAVESSSDAGAHPTDHESYVAVNLDTERLEPAKITLLFEAQDVIAALKRNGVLSELSSSDERESLQGYLRSLPGNRCENFYSMASHFAVGDIHESSATVVFGPEDRGGYCHGPSGYFPVEVPIPNRSAGWFATAREEGSYVAALARERARERQQ